MVLLMVRSFASGNVAGVSSLYRGLAPAVMRHWVYTGARVALYEQLRNTSNHQKCVFSVACVLLPEPVSTLLFQAEIGRQYTTTTSIDNFFHLFILVMHIWAKGSNLQLQIHGLSVICFAWSWRWWEQHKNCFQMQCFSASWTTAFPETRTLDRVL